MMKRLFDIIVALSGLLFFAPVMLVVAAAIMLSSPGPAIYAQTRVGRYGLPFRIYKFRTMVVNAERLGSSVTTGNDRRITAIGRFLRQSKLDELPQLWNVLRGDMSMVGPRPDVPEIVASYTPEQRRILEVRPGITSVASLHLRDEEQLLSLAHDPDRAYLVVLVPAKVQMAMLHVDNQSPVFDFRVLVETCWVLTVGRVWPLPEHPIVVELRDHLHVANTVNLGAPALLAGVEAANSLDQA